MVVSLRAMTKALDPYSGLVGPGEPQGNQIPDNDQVFGLGILENSRNRTIASGSRIDLGNLPTRRERSVSVSLAIQ